MYISGYGGVPKDFAEAAKWYRRAAEQGNVPAQIELGFMYASGEGVPQNHMMAHMWFSIAASQGNEDAPRERDIVAQRMTPDQIAEAQRLAREWKPKAE